jgi:hypothetical protein
MLINSALNSIYCLMYFFEYTITCVPTFAHSGKVKDNCLQKEIWISTVGSLLKFMGNFSYTQMSLNRYLLVGKDPKKWIEKVAKVKISHLMVICSVCSSLLSLVLIFQNLFVSNPVNGKPGYLHEENYQYHHYLWRREPFLDLNQNDPIIVRDRLNNQLPYLFTFTFIHDFFGYFLFCILITVVDIMTIQKLRQSLSEKVNSLLLMRRRRRAKRTLKPRYAES